MAFICIEKSIPYVMAIRQDSQGVLQDVYLDYDDEKASIGSIFKGKVVEIFEEHGYGFVDIGLQKSAYLALAKVPLHVTLKRGHELLVQVEKTPYLEKGSVVSALVEYSGSYLVLTSFFKGIRLSKELSTEDRKRLKAMLSPLIPKNMGLMVRTASGIAEAHQLLNEIELLIERQFNCEKQLHFHSSPCVYQALSGVDKWILSYGSEVAEIRLTSPEMFSIQHWPQDLQNKILRNPTPVGGWFAEYGLDSIWSKLCQRQVALKSGAALVIDETEAFAIIDVNSEGYIHQSKSITLAFAVNSQACVEIARQIRLRNLSGAILIDFIDMHSDDERKQISELLLTALAFDKESVRSYGFTTLGIYQLTRRRRRPSLKQVIGDLNYWVVSPAHRVYQLNRELLRLKQHIHTERVVVYAAENTLLELKQYLTILQEKHQVLIQLELDLSLNEGYRLTLK